jgi:prolyl-tRNA editing enzyme YbaK/EbsC (Cys-tRNA(Pro) deacylase)
VHANAERVASWLRANGASGEIRELTESARTANDAAAALGVAVGAIVKSLIFTADGSPVLVLASGDHQVDTVVVATLLGVDRVRRADPDVVRAATGFAIGGVAPVAHPAPLLTLVDRHLESFAVIWAAAGVPDAVFPTTYNELLHLSAGTPADVAAST